VSPPQGFAAEAATTATILASTHLGFALSTTQVASGSVIGSGLGKNRRAVRWRVAGRIAIGWLVTLPSAGLMAAGAELIARIPTWGIIIDAAIGAAVILVIFLRSRRNRVSSGNVTDGVRVIEADAATATAGPAPSTTAGPNPNPAQTAVRAQTTVPAPATTSGPTEPNTTPEPTKRAGAR
jgi:PiT family inorganic phosphate transporter